MIAIAVDLLGLRSSIMKQMASIGAMLLGFFW